MLDIDGDAVMEDFAENEEIAWTVVKYHLNNKKNFAVVMATFTITGGNEVKNGK